MNEIERLQDNLLLIRRAAGWTAEEFGEKIGVTRQTINNLEAKRNKLNKTQYIAMRAVIEAEPLAKIDYVSMVDALTMQPVEKADRDVLVAMAVYIGKTRLIDNFSYEV